MVAASASKPAVDQDASDGRTRSSPAAVFSTVTTDGSNIGPTKRAWSMTASEKDVGTGALLVVRAKSRFSNWNEYARRSPLSSSRRMSASVDAAAWRVSTGRATSSSPRMDAAMSASRASAACTSRISAARWSRSALIRSYVSRSVADKSLFSDATVSSSSVASLHARWRASICFVRKSDMGHPFLGCCGFSAGG